MLLLILRLRDRSYFCAVAAVRRLFANSCSSRGEGFFFCFSNLFSGCSAKAVFQRLLPGPAVRVFALHVLLVKNGLSLRFQGVVHEKRADLSNGRCTPLAQNLFSLR